MMQRFTIKHTGLSLWLKWIIIAALMAGGHYLMDGYKTLTAVALLVAVSGVIAAIIVTIEEEHGKRRFHQG